MPAIVLPNVIANAAPASAPDVAENLFTPRSAPNTLAGMNGFMDKVNMDATMFPLGRELVRRGSYADGGMVGATANQDFFEDWYTAFTTPLDDIDDAGITIPGAAKTYRLRFNVTQVIISWQVGIICDGPAELNVLNVPPGQSPTELPQTYASMRLYVDGFPVTRYTQGFQGSRRTLLNRHKARYQYPNNPIHPDHRWWTCSAMFYVGDPHSAGLPVGTIIPTGTGFHTAEIRVAQRSNVARCKTRNMSIRYNR